MKQNIREELLAKIADVVSAYSGNPTKENYNAIVELFLSSTYDTAYEEGVRDTMELIGENEIIPEGSIYSFTTNGINQERSRLRLALSELLKK